MQAQLQSEAIAAVAAIETEVIETLAVEGAETIVDTLTLFCSKEAEKTLRTWRDFFGTLITTYVLRINNDQVF